MGVGGDGQSLSAGAGAVGTVPQQEGLSGPAPDPLLTVDELLTRDAPPNALRALFLGEGWDWRRAAAS